MSRTRLAGVAATLVLGTAVALTLVAPLSASALPPTISVGNGPTDVEFSPNGATAYVSNGTDGTLSFINTASSTVTGTIAVGANPIDIAVSPDGTRVYVLLGVVNANSPIVVVNASTRTVAGSINAGYEARGIVVTNDSQKIYASNSNGFARIINATSGAITRSIDVGINATTVSISPDGRFVYVATGANSPEPMMVIDTATETRVREVWPGPLGMTSDSTPDGAAVLWPVSQEVQVFGTTWESSPILIPVLGEGRSVTVTPVGSQAYVTLPFNDTVVVIDVAWGKVVDTIDVGDHPIRAAISPSGTRVYVLNQAAATISVITRSESVVDPTIATRVSGGNRYETAVEVSKSAYQTSEYVFIANGLNYPDALSAAAAAAKVSAPLLLTDPDALPAVVSTEIERLGATKVVVVGGLGSVSQAVRDELQSLVPNDLVELQGADRYQTSREVVWWAFGDSGADRIFIATGATFPDALSAAPAAGHQDAPVLLVAGNAAGANAVTTDLIHALGAQDVAVVGGFPSVARQVAYDTSLATNLSSMVRLFGNSRFTTSQNINGSQFDSATTVYLANGLNFPDALAGGAVAAAQDAPLYVIPQDCVPQRVLNDITRLGAIHVVLLGGTPSLSANVEAMTPCAP